MIYFAQAGSSGPIKIGYTKDVAKRMSSLRYINHSELTVLGSIEGTLEDEHDLHIKFRDSRIHGEWFTPTPDLMQYLVEVVGFVPEPAKPKPKRPPQPKEGRRSPPHAEFLTVQDIADELGLSRAAIRAYIKIGRLPGELLGNRIRISRREWQIYKNGYWTKQQNIA